MSAVEVFYLVIAKSRLQISLSWPNLYKFYLKITSLTEFYRKTKDMVLKALKESLMKALALGHLNCQILFSFLCRVTAWEPPLPPGSRLRVARSEEHTV